jgi:ElaB/YqjD/DUF883 family membrane-anchored ribosome-binding protein
LAGLIGEWKWNMLGSSKKVQDKVQDAVDDTREQLISLRDQVEQVLNKKVTPAITDVAGRAEDAVHTARDYTATKADKVSKKVRGQPLAAIAVSAAVGYFLGRIAR